MDRPVVVGDAAAVVDAVEAVTGAVGVDDDDAPVPSVVLGGDDAAAAGLGGGGLFP